MTAKTVLLVEDNPGDTRLLREMFMEDGSLDVDLTCVSSMAEAESHLAGCTVDVVLLDLGLPDAKGLTAIRRARMAAPAVPLVVLTGMDDEVLAVQSLQEGAQDYLIKGQIETRGLLRALRYATERKRLERLKDEFVSTVSHELRTPLTSIAGSLGLLTGNAAGVLSEPAARLLTIAHSNSQRLVRLVNDILDIEKLESGHVVFDFRRVEVRPLVEQAIESIRSVAEGHNVRIRLEVAAGVGDVRADTDRLAQVVTNLLSNAVKFSLPDGEVLVTVAKEDGGERVRISVRDHGPGISADFKPRIFERFAQADATSARAKGGTGLGLSIVKQIVDRLGGEVGFDDAPGEGTIFRVELPAWYRIVDLSRDERIRDTLTASAATLANLPDAAGDRLPSASRDHRGGHMTMLRVLHVDDEPDIREVVEFALGLDPDLVVRSCASGEEALVVADAWTPHIVLLDVMMPVMDGTATLAHLRENLRTVGIPVVFMTARAQTRELDLLRSLGAVGVIPKPFDPITLAASVREHAEPPDDRRGAMRQKFLQRVDGDLVALAGHWSALENGSAVSSSLAKIRSIAHGLAGSGGIFGFDELSDAAATLEEAVILEGGGSGTRSEIRSALERVVACVQTRGGRTKAADRIYK